MVNSPKQRNLRSNSIPNTSADSVTLPQIESLLERMKREIVDMLKNEVDKQTVLVKALLKQVEELSAKNAVLEKKCIKLEENMVKTSTVILEEINDRDRRRKNLVISGIAESTSGSIEEKNRDKERVNCLLKELSIDGDEILRRIHRIGKQVEGRDRLLRVVCCDEESKIGVLRQAKLLRNTSFKKVYINPDLTKTQREERKRLREELKRRKDVGEDVTIRYGRIVAASDRNFL